jgi:bacillithiol biosynthesis cysteine-adding enzyme BshC
MKTEIFPRNTLTYYNDLQIKLAEDQQKLIDFIGLPFKQENITKQIKQKKAHFSLAERIKLSAVLKDQYLAIQTSEKVTKNIELIEKENTFTVTTGHQLTLFGGSAYFFYKIIHAISLCQKLQEDHPAYNFIPVFWMASEDHDKEEIAETTIYSRKIRWETNQTGPVGAFDLNAEFEACKKEFLQLFSTSEFNEIEQTLLSFSGSSLSEGMFHFLNSIFQQYGLLILEPNRAELKRMLIPIFEKEITQSISYQAVSATNSELQQIGVKPQAQIQPINFFHLQAGKRSKIIKVEDGFSINNQFFTKEELLLEINNHPEFFSPNVFLRPLYQELILPNLAYIGGPGELSYWIQLKGIFDAYLVPFPFLVNRISIFQMDKSLHEKLVKLNIPFLDFAAKTKEELKKEFLSKNKEVIDWTETKVLIDLAHNKAHFLFDKHAPSNKKMLDAEWKTIEKTIDQITQKLDKQLNIKYDVALNQIEQVKDKFFPNGSSQERVFHFFHFCSNGSLEKINLIMSAIDPFESGILVIQV